MYIYFYTFVCKVNVYETAAMSEAFEKAGYTVTQVRELADILVINSCTVTSESDSKLMQTIRRIRRESPTELSFSRVAIRRHFPMKPKPAERTLSQAPRTGAALWSLRRNF